MYAQWVFPESNTKHRTGIGESGIETFRGNSIGSLVREICQNSLDAIKDDSKPVLVEFKYFDIATREFPDKDELEKTFDRCKKYSDEHMQNKDTSNFFENALKIIREDKIPMLRISDFNTSGLSGSKNTETVNPWTSLIYSDGVSDKSASSGGSYGIGKNAIFACSEFVTAFYSTLDSESVKASQGVAKLISFKNDKGNYCESIGYYGNNQNPVYNLINLDESYNRIESGTDIFIAAFQMLGNWEADIITSAIENYLLSIFNNKLVVKVNDTLINRENLESLVSIYSDKLKYGRDYYEVLTNHDTHTTKLDIGGTEGTDKVGEVTLKVLYDKGLKRRVLMSRSNGMKIYDQDRLPGGIYCAGVLIMDDENVNEIFRSMENPQHDAWEPSRAGNKYKEYREIFQQLKRNIKQFILTTGQTTIFDEVDAAGLGEYLPNEELREDESESIKNEESLEHTIRNITYKKPDVSVDSATSKDQGREENAIEEPAVYDEDGNLEGYSHGNGKKNGGRPPAGSYKPDKDGDSRTYANKKKIGVNSIRIMVTDSGKKTYKMLFTLKEPIDRGYIAINMSGEQGAYDARIKNPNTKGGLFNNNKKLKYSKNKIYVDKLSEKKKHEITFNLDYPVVCSLEAQIYGY